MMTFGRHATLILALAAALAAGCAGVQTPETRAQKIDRVAARAETFYPQFLERLYRTRFLAFRPLTPRGPSLESWVARYPEFRAELEPAVAAHVPVFERGATRRLKTSLDEGFTDAQLDAILAIAPEPVWDEYVARTAIAQLLVAEITPGAQPGQAELQLVAQRARALTSDNDAFATAHQSTIDRLRSSRVLRKYYDAASTSAIDEADHLAAQLRADPKITRVTSKWRAIATAHQ